MQLIRSEATQRRGGGYGAGNAVWRTTVGKSANDAIRTAELAHLESLCIVSQSGQGCVCVPCMAKARYITCRVNVCVSACLRIRV